MFKIFIEKLFPEKKLTLLIPYLLGAIMFIVLPTILLFVNAFKPIGNPEQYSIVESSSTWKIIFRSVWLGLAAALISLVLAFPYTWIVARSNSKTFKTLSLSLLLTPLLIFSVAKIFALRVTLIRMYDYNPKNLRQEWIMIVGMIYMYMPFIIIPLYSVLNNIPDSLIEASNDLGYNMFKTMYKVIVPYSLKAIFSGLAIVFMLSSTSLLMSNTLTDDNTAHKLVGNLIDNQTNDMLLGNKLGTAWGSLLALITISVVMGIYLLIYLLPVVIRKINGGVHE